MQPSQYRLAKESGVSVQRIGVIVAGRRAITADTDLRLCRICGLSNAYWLRARAADDTEVAAKVLAPVLRRIKVWAGSDPYRVRPSQHAVVPLNRAVERVARVMSSAACQPKREPAYRAFSRVHLRLRIETVVP